jgi:hypothetical protein
MGMRHRGQWIADHSPGGRIRRGAVALTACAGLAFGFGAPALADTSAAATQTVTALASPSAQSVTLPTGDRVIVTTVNGHATYCVLGSSGTAAQFESYQDPSGDHYVIPDEALPYLGNQLDKSLFDVSALLRAGAATGDHIPVSVSLPAGTSGGALPGVTLTSPSSGYLTATSGAAFAAGLRAAIGADVAAGRRVGSTPLFGGLASMSLAAPGLAGGSAPGAIQPRYPLHFLQINVTDLNGAPTNGFGVLLNVDSVRRENTIVLANDGIARIAVPAGNYSAAFNFDDFDASGNLTASRQVFFNDFSVSATALTTTVNVAESSATVPFSVTTPRPATQDSVTANWNRTDAAGGGSEFSSILLANVPYFANSQPAPTVGAQHYVVQWAGAGPSTGDQYRYDVAYASDGIPADQTHAIGPNDVATVHQTFFNDPASPGGGSLLAGSYDSSSIGVGETGGEEPYAGPVTQYLGSADGGQWGESFLTSTGTFYNADIHTFDGGQQYSVDWAHGPVAPDFGKHTAPQPASCFACASGGVLFAEINPAGDSEPDHLGFPFFASGTSHFTLYQNGTPIVDLGSGYIGAEVTGVPAAPATYRLVYDADNTGISGISQTLTTDTDVTFQYTPGPDPKTTLPSIDFCDPFGVMAAPCQVLPVLNLSYHMFTDDTNTARTVSQGLELNVGHVTYDGQGSHAAITSASVSVSFDGGATWQQARVVKIGDFGSYDAFWQNPKSAAGTSPELRVTATDAAGGSISQTVTAAYTISAFVH